MMLREFMLVIVEVRFEESYVEGLVNVKQVRVAAEVESVIDTLVVHSRDWEWY